MSADIARLAEDWIGTPYVHQSSLQGVGTDCLGLIRGIWRARYGEEPEATPAYTPDWDEPGKAEVLLAAASRHLEPILPSQAEPGDVLLFRMHRRSVAKHLGILTQTEPVALFVHAYSRVGVVRSPLSRAWQSRCVAAFRFP